MAKWQLSRRSISWIRGILIATVSLLALYLSPPLLLRIPAVQHWAGEMISQELRLALGANVSIDRIGLEGWEHINALDVSISEPNAGEILSTDTLSLKLSPFGFLSRGELQVSSARLFGLKLYLATDSLGQLNVQPLIDHLSAPQDTLLQEKSPLQLSINTLLVRNAQVHISPWGKPKQSLEELSLKLSNLSTQQGMSAQLEELSFDSSQGFKLTNLSSHISFTLDNKLELRELELLLPQSKVQVPQLTLDLNHKGLAMLQAIKLDTFDIALADLTPLYPALDSLRDEHLLLKASNLHSSSGQITLSDLQLTLGDKLKLHAQAGLKHDSLGKLHEVDMQISRLGVSSKLIALAPHLIPQSREIVQALSPLGDIFYNGRVQYQPQGQSLTQGLLETQLGRWQTNLQLYPDASGRQHLIGKLSTAGFSSSPLVVASASPIKQLEHIEGEIELAVEFSQQSIAPSGFASVKLRRLDYAGSSYRNIEGYLQGSANQNYRFTLSGGDPKADLIINGTFRLTPNGIQNLSLDIPQGKLLLPAIGQPIESIQVEGLQFNLSSLDLSQASGNLTLPYISIKPKGEDEPFTLKHLTLALKQTESKTQRIEVNTPWAKANLEGIYQIDQLPKQVLYSLTRPIPALAQIINAPKPRGRQSESFLIDAQIDSLPQALTKFFKLPIQQLATTNILAYYNAKEHDFQVNLESQGGKLNEGIQFDKLSLLAQPSKVHISGDYHSKGVHLNQASIQITQEANNIHLGIDLGKDLADVPNGQITLGSQLSTIGQGNNLKDLQATIQIEPSRLKLHTEQWQIAPAVINLAHNFINIQGLKLSTDTRSLIAQGSMGGLNTQSSININLQQINLRYILEMIGVDFDLLDSDLSGRIEAQLNNGVVQAQAQVNSPHFLVSGYDVGGIDIGLAFNSQDLLINLSGKVQQSHGGGSEVKGWIKPANGAGIDLDFTTRDLDASFLSRFLSNIFTHVQGYSTGQIRLKGLFEQGVTIEGETDIHKGGVTIGVLGTSYYFDHHFSIEEDRFKFDNVRIQDNEGHSGLVNGYITHEYLDKFDVQLEGSQIKGLKVLQTSSPKDMPVYGTAYASGWAHIKSQGERLNIAVDLRSQKGTDIMLDFNPTTAERNEGFIHFTRLRPESLDQEIKTPSEPIETETPIDLNLKLDITPVAKLGIRLTADMTSELRGQAEGSLQINAPSQGQAEVYGTLGVLDGTFAFRFKDIAHKLFKIERGGRVAFRGSPSEALLDLSASYKLTANISDLDANLSSMAGRTNIPVTCMLGLSGNLSHPDIQFDLKFPEIDSDIERRVNALLNSKDAVMRQMFYLMALGKFYPEHGNSTSNNWTSVASSALSEQLSYLLGNLSQTINLGTNIKTSNTNFEDTDVELLFSSSLFGNRLTISGNIGYHNNLYLRNEYLGEFEIEYKLSPNGSIRLKGYNKYNNMYQYLRQSLMTQGVGILLRKRFDRFSDLWTKSNLLRSLRSKSYIQDSIAQDSISPQ